MAVLLVTEKPSRLTDKGMLSAVFDRWPNQRVFGFHLPIPLRLRQQLLMRSYPRGLSLKDYPLTIPVPHVGYSPSDLIGYEVLSPKERVVRELTQDDLDSCDQIFYLCDTGHRDVYHFEQVRRQLLPHVSLDTVVQPCDWRTPTGWARQTFVSVESFAENCGFRLRYGEAKMYFDYNWNANAVVVLGLVLRAQQALTANPIPISKFGLQLLYWLKDQPEPISFSDVSDVMHRWEGTGRYPRPTRAFTGSTLGSASSRAEIVEQLILAGYITKQPGEVEGKGARHQLSLMGRELLTEYLHPDCKDADLPFRLDEWCRQGLDVAKPAMDRYLKTFFGKQLRFWRQRVKDQ